MIPKSFIDSLNQDVDIIDLVGESVELKQSGDSAKGCCPFHEEKTPSFTVSRARRAYKCFGCGASGGPINWVMQRESVSFPEAVRRLAVRLGREVPADRPVDRKAAAAKKDLAEILKGAQGVYAKLLDECGDGHPAARELTRRGISRDVAKMLGLGVAPDAWDTLIDSGLASPEQLVEAGLAVERKSRNGHFDLMRNRLVIPIRDERGAIVSFAGRALEGSAPEVPKYINGPETSVYRKSNVLYNLDRAAKSIREKKTAIVVEGYFDAMVPSLRGLDNLVAPCGTALTGAQLQLLWRYADRVVFCFDSDAPGQAASLHAAHLALENMPEGKAAAVAVLPDSDPDEFVRKYGAESFEVVIATATPVPEFVIQTMAKERDLSSIDAKARFVGQVSEIRIASPILRTFVNKAAAAVVGLSDAEFGAIVNATQPKVPTAPEARGGAGGRAAAATTGKSGRDEAANWPRTSSARPARIVVGNISIPPAVDDDVEDIEQPYATEQPAVPAPPAAVARQQAWRARGQGAPTVAGAVGAQGDGAGAAVLAIADAGSFGWEVFAFRIGNERYEPNAPGNQAALAGAHGAGLRPVCLCVPGTPELVIAKMRFFVLKRMPGSGFRHHPRCIHFAPSEDQSGRALVSDAFGSDEPGVFNVKIAFAFSRHAGASIPRGPSNPSGTIKAAEKGLTCGGVLHMLWDEAQFNRWCPKMEGKRSWSVVRKHLLATASQIMTKGSALSEHLLMALPHRPGEEARIEEAHQEMIKPLFGEDKSGGRTVKLFVGELKAVETPPTGARLACANFFGHPIRIGDAMASRLLRRYEGAFAMLEAKLEVRLVICATVMGQGDSLMADQVFLMLTNRNWIPFSNRYEREVAETMTKEGRWFIRPLTYDARSDQPVHSFLLTDTGDIVTPMNIVPPALAVEAAAKREALIAANPGGWVWRVEQREIPPGLPRAQRRTPSPPPTAASGSESAGAQTVS